MTLDDYQAAAARTLNPSLDNRQQALDAAAGIAEEAGEVLAHIRKHHFQNRELSRDRLAEELGDVLWCVAAVATTQGMSLDALARGNIAKLGIRHQASGIREPSPDT